MRRALQPGQHGRSAITRNTGIGRRARAGCDGQGGTFGRAGHAFAMHNDTYPEAQRIRLRIVLHSEEVENGKDHLHLDLHGGDSGEIARLLGNRQHACPNIGVRSLEIYCYDGDCDVAARYVMST